MRLSKISEFRRIMFTPDSAPSLDTLRKQIAAGELPGGTVLAGRYYVDLDEFDRATDAIKRLEARKRELEQHPLLKGLI